MTTIEDEVNCPDQAGKATGLPDFAAFVTGVQQCSPVAFPVNPPQLVCSTKDDHPQTYYGGSGASKYFEKLAGTKLHGLYLASNDSAVATRQQDLLLAFPEHAGMKSDQHPYISSTAPHSAYTPLVQKLKADKSNFAISAMGSAAVIALRQEAVLQGLDDPKMQWICISCYDKTLPAADSADGTYEPLGILPFEEAKYNKNLAALVKLVGNGKLDQFSIYGFAATLLFKQAVDDSVAKGGTNAVTRADVLGAAKGITNFDAGGMIGVNNIAERKTGPCFLVMRVKNKKWVRAVPVEARHVRLQPEERDEPATRPDGLTDGARRHGDRRRGTGREGRSHHRRIDRHRSRRGHRVRTPGMKLVLAARRAERLRTAVAELREDGFDAVGVSTDVAELEQVRDLAAAAYDAFGRVDVAFFNAGSPSADRLVDPDLDVWRDAIGTNVLGLLHGLKAFVPRMLHAGAECSVLATTSGAGSTGPRTTPRPTRRRRQPSCRSWRASTARRVTSTSRCTSGSSSRR